MKKNRLPNQEKIINFCALCVIFLGVFLGTLFSFAERVNAQQCQYLCGGGDSGGAPFCGSNPCCNACGDSSCSCTTLPAPTNGVSCTCSGGGGGGNGDAPDDGVTQPCPAGTIFDTSKAVNLVCTEATLWCKVPKYTGPVCGQFANGVDKNYCSDSGAACCSITAPAKAPLISPANDPSYSNPLSSPVTLDWGDITNWGDTCGLNAVRRYRLFVGTSSNLTESDLVVQRGESAATQYNFSGVNGQTYYWRVDTRNRPDGPSASSNTRTFIIGGVCNATAPTITSVIRNSATSATINWTPGTSGVSQKIFISQDPNQTESDCTLPSSPGCVVNVTDLPSSQSSYSTGNVLASGTVYYIKVVNYKDATCSTSSNSTNSYTSSDSDDPLPYLSSCTLSPSSIQLQVGESATVTSTVASNSIISQVDFGSTNSSIVSVTSPDTVGPYTSNITSVTPGSANITSIVYFQDSYVACTNVAGGNGDTSGGSTSGGSGNGEDGESSVVSTNTSDAWWQTVDSDITSNGSLESEVPSGEYFGLPGTGGFPGIPTYTTTTNLTNSNSSEANWLTQNTNNSYPVFDYSYFENLIPTGVTFNTVGSSNVPGSFFASGGTQTYGYYWYKYDGGAGNIDLHITSDGDIGNRKVILLVENANLFFEGNMNLNDGLGFFMTVVDKDINVDSAVGGGGYNLEGFYICDNNFDTGAGTSQLKIRGAVVAYDGIIMGRDLGTGNLTTPGEQFEYAPDQVISFPAKIASRKISWKEVAP